MTLTDAAHHYLSRVLRCRGGDSVILFNGDGYDYSATIVAINKKETSLAIAKRQANNCQSPLKIVLIQGLSKGEKMDFVMQKASELGVSEIYPVQTEHTAVKLDDARQAKKHQHWQAILQSAAEQCGRAELPTLHPLTDLATALSAQSSSTQNSSAQSSAAKVVFSPSANGSLKSMPQPGSVSFLIGPEGGLSAADLALAKQHGFIEKTLGKRILRTETAALAAIAVAQTLWGDA